MADRIELLPAPESVAAARRWSVQRAEQAGFGAVSDTIALLVSEIVSNVVLHARTPCELSLATVDHRMRFEVRDASDAMPAPSAAPDPLSSSGRGMALVEALSEAHGARPLPGGGKVVWFQVAEPAESNGDG